MNAIQHLILRIIRLYRRPVQFRTIVHHIGIENYISIHNALRRLVDLNWITETPNKDDDLIFYYWPTLEGEYQYEQSQGVYANLKLSIPVQKGFEE